MKADVASSTGGPSSGYFPALAAFPRLTSVLADDMLGREDMLGSYSEATMADPPG